MNKFGIFVILLFAESAVFAALIPINIQADTVIIDEQNGVSTYIGAAKVSQGSLILSANKIQVFNTAGKVNKAVAQGDKNQLAHYQQNQLNQPRFVEARAQTITYLADKQFLHLKGNASLLQGLDYFSGNILKYDIKNDSIEAEKSIDDSQKVKFKINVGDQTFE